MLLSLLRGSIAVTPRGCVRACHTVEPQRNKVGKTGISSCPCVLTRLQTGKGEHKQGADYNALWASVVNGTTRTGRELGSAKAEISNAGMRAEGQEQGRADMRIGSAKLAKRSL